MKRHERYESYFKEKEELFYNYRRNKSQLNEPVIFCANNPESSEHYGKIQRIFKATKKTLDVRKANSPKVKQLVKYCQAFLNEWLEVEKLGEPKVSFIAGYNAINPKDIVDSAGAWDNIEFINYLYDETKFFDQHDGVITEDGAVFFEATKYNLVSLIDLSEQKLNENKNLTLFRDLNLNDKIKALSSHPYNSSLYYHASAEENYRNIVRSGIKGEEIWVSKGKPIDDYDKGILFALDLRGIELKPDVRWKASDQVYITLENISPKRIVRVFDYFDDLDMREDILALKVHKKPKQAIIDIIEEYEI